MKKIKLALVALASLLMASSCEDKYPDVPDGIYAEITTDYGTMFAKLYHEATPATAANFIALAEGNHPAMGVDSLKGKPFYDGLLFHRVMKGFMIQGGDPFGSGSGNVGYAFDQEIVDTLKHDAPGVMSMANAGPNTNGSQFFIMHKATPSLDGSYNVFGKVMMGTEVIDSIAGIEVNARQNHRPLTDTKMNTVRIIRKGKEARKFDAVQTIQDYIDLSKEKKKQRDLEREELAKKAEQLRMAKEMEINKRKASAKAIRGSKVTYVTLKEPTGASPKYGSDVKINYAGYFMDGNLFDTSDYDLAKSCNRLNPRKPYGPMSMKYTKEMGAIQGFKDAVLSLKKGQKIMAFIPSELAYGDRNYGPIPANSDLVFELELLDE